MVITAHRSLLGERRSSEENAKGQNGIRHSQSFPYRSLTRTSRDVAIDGGGCPGYSEDVTGLKDTEVLAPEGTKMIEGT